jgi:hypothetical protein
MHFTGVLLLWMDGWVSLFYLNDGTAMFKRTPLNASVFKLSDMLTLFFAQHMVVLVLDT